MIALRIGLIDLGASINLAEVTDLLGHQVERVSLLAGTPHATFGPFDDPAEVKFQEGEDEVTLRLHSPGVMVIRRARKVEGYESIDWPDDLHHWRTTIRDQISDSIYEPYNVEPAVEYWDLRIVDKAPEDGRSFILADGAKGVDPDLIEREGEAVLLGRDRAIIWGNPDGIAEVIDVLELARAILVEFRTYDAYLDRRLEGSFKSLDRLWAAGGLFRSARAALRDVSQVRVEVARLTDPLHGTGKAFGDRFAERLHEKIQQRLRVDAWEQAVNHKTEVLEDMFHLAQEEANHRRALVLETMIVLLFILDLILIFKIK